MTEETLKQMGGEELVSVFTLGAPDDRVNHELLRRLKAYEGIKKEVERLREEAERNYEHEQNPYTYNFYDGQVYAYDKILKSLES